MGVIEALLLGFGLFVAASVAAFAYGRWRVRQRLRIRPGTRSRAPTSWLVSTSAPARLHRRLRRAAALARLAGSRDAALAPLVDDIEDQAVALEPHLVVAARAGRAGREARNAVHEQVTAIEAVAARLATSARAELLAGAPDPIAALSERLDALEAARCELDLIEARAGLRPA